MEPSRRTEEIKGIISKYTQPLGIDWFDYL